jgi:hypothetical protein
VTVHSEVRCDHKDCFDSVDGGYLGSTPQEAVERAVEEYGWEERDGLHYCDMHLGGSP